MAKTSVIIPTYNRRNVVLKAVKSVLLQTEADTEIIVVDDGSDDDTESAVRNFNDSRIHYFYKENGGPSSARNTGLSKASGRYVAFLDSDDFWPENYLEIMLSCLEKNSDFSAAYSPITLLYQNGTLIKSYKRPQGKSGVITSDLFRSGFIWPSASVFHSSLWKDFFFDESLTTSEDSDAFLRLSTVTKFLFVPDVEAFHTISADSISAGAGVTCSRLLSLERFYFRLGGDKFVPAQTARRRLSHACRKVAEDRRDRGAKTAALGLYKHAVHYWPLDLRLYADILKTRFLSSEKDPEPEWKMPAPLAEPLGTHRFS